MSDTATRVSEELRLPQAGVRAVLALIDGGATVPFEAPAFRDDVRTIDDVKPGMILDGVVTNVTAFGAFVDIGVHQDGLVHVSQLADRFVKDPHAAIHVGDRVKVKVLEVDLARKRISLSRRAVSS